MRIKTKEEAIQFIDRNRNDFKAICHNAGKGKGESDWLIKITHIKSMKSIFLKEDYVAGKGKFIGNFYCEYNLSSENAELLIKFMNDSLNYSGPNMNELTAEELANLRLDASWSNDCGGKMYYESDIISISCRFCPSPTPSATATIYLNSKEDGMGLRLASKEFSNESENALRAELENWSSEQYLKIVSVLSESFPVERII